MKIERTILIVHIDKGQWQSLNFSPDAQIKQNYGNEWKNSLES